jgi:hypothetical protein
VDGSTYSTVSTAHGTVTWNPDGSFSYTPNAGYFGTDTFTYIAYDGDGNQSNSATVSIQVVLPKIDLLDDANNDGAINSADEPVKDTGTGAIILVSNDSAGSGSNADADHLAQLNITALDSVFESLPSSLSGWTLDLNVLDGDGLAKIWNSLDKTTELDTDGSASWNLSDGIGSVPTSVFLEATAAGTYEVQLALYAPSAATPAVTSQVKVTVQAGTLIADTIDETSGVIAESGTLPHGQGAVIPLDNIDQWYNDKRTTFLDTGASTYDNQGYFTDIDLPANGGPDDVPHDEYLLPVVVKGVPGDTYSLEIPNDVHVWASDDRVVQITGGEALDMGTGGTATIYVQGIADGTGTLHLDWTHAGVTTDAVDNLPITVFEFQGPADVPNFSTYDYNAIGVPATSLDGELRWSLPNDFSSAEIANSLSNGNGVTIQWGYGGSDQRWANFTVNQYYTWDYNVNVVQISISSPTNGSGQATSAFSVNQGTAQLPGNNGANLQPIKLGAQHLLATGIVISSAPAGSYAITWGAGITMTGPEGYWGVDRMMVGFTQVVTSIRYVGTYSNGSTLNATLNTTTPLHDTDNGALPGTDYWYGAVPSNRPNIISGRSSTDLQVIGSSDVPTATIPAYLLKGLGLAAVGDSSLASVNLSVNFQLYISAGIYDGRPEDKLYPTGNVYTELAMAPPIAGSDNSWSWATTGAVNNFVYAPDAATTHLQGPANSQWSQQVRGDILSNAYGQGNIASANNDWF